MDRSNTSQGNTWGGYEIFFREDRQGIVVLQLVEFSEDSDAKELLFLRDIQDEL